MTLFYTFARPSILSLSPHWAPNTNARFEIYCGLLNVPVASASTLLYLIFMNTYIYELYILL